MSEISVIVPARDAAATLPATLAALAAQDVEREFEVIVVDDGSRDATAALARAAPLGATVLTQPGAGPARRGTPASRRRAAGCSRSPTPTACPSPAGCAPGSRRSPAPTSSRAPSDRIPPRSRMPFDRSVWVDGDAALYETANLFCRRELFDRIGGFEDWLGTGVIGKPLAEDVWFGWRARRAGASVAFSDAALVNHAVFPRGAREYVAERARLVYFPAIVGEDPRAAPRAARRRALPQPPHGGLRRRGARRRDRARAPARGCRSRSRRPTRRWSAPTPGAGAAGPARGRRRPRRRRGRRRRAARRKPEIAIPGAISDADAGEAMTSSSASPEPG